MNELFMFNIYSCNAKRETVYQRGSSIRTRKVDKDEKTTNVLAVFNNNMHVGTDLKCLNFYMGVDKV